jgi:hypothetical protein
MRACTHRPHRRWRWRRRRRGRGCLALRCSRVTAPAAQRKVRLGARAHLPWWLPKEMPRRWLHGPPAPHAAKQPAASGADQDAKDARCKRCKLQAAHARCKQTTRSVRCRDGGGERCGGRRRRCCWSLGGGAAGQVSRRLCPSQQAPVAQKVEQSRSFFLSFFPSQQHCRSRTGITSHQGVGLGPVLPGPQVWRRAGWLVAAGRRRRRRRRRRRQRGGACGLGHRGGGCRGVRGGRGGRRSGGGTRAAAAMGPHALERQAQGLLLCEVCRARDPQLCRMSAASRARG